MIPRYTRPEMAAIWSPQTRFRIWFEIEAHAADAMAELGIIPKKAAETPTIPAPSTITSTVCDGISELQHCSRGR